MSVPDPFSRTHCACPECQACCRRQPGPLVPGDLERIAAHLQLPVRVAALKFWASPGGVVANRATGEQVRVGTITPRMREGRCVFLEAHRDGGFGTLEALGEDPRASRGQLAVERIDALINRARFL